MVEICELARNTIQVPPSRINSSEWHRLRLCSILCAATDRILLLDSDRKVILLHHAFHARGFLGYPKGQESGLHQAYICGAWLFLSLIVVEFGLMWDSVVGKTHRFPPPLMLELAKVSSQQTWPNGSPVDHLCFCSPLTVPLRVRGTTGTGEDYCWCDKAVREWAGLLMALPYLPLGGGTPGC